MITFGQTTKKKNFWIKQGVLFTNAFIAGSLSATNEVTTHNYYDYKRKHPNSNPQWDNPKISFQNKYKSWPTDKSAAFPGSKTYLVWWTDGYHRRNTVRNVLIASNVGISLTLYEKPKLKHILIQSGIQFIGFALGSGATHHFYKN